MKPGAKPAIFTIPITRKKKIGYLQASIAIQKKLEEIKNESRLPSAVNNNLSLFRYKV